MKRSTRYLSVFLSFVLLSTAFSTIVYADEVEVKPYYVQHNLTIENDIPRTYYLDNKLITPNNGTQEKYSVDYQDGANGLTAYTLRYKGWYRSHYTIWYTDNTYMLEEGKSYHIDLNNMYHSLLVDYRDQLWYIRNYSTVEVNLVYFDMTTESVSNVTINHVDDSAIYDISFDCTPSKDVKSINIIIKSSIPKNSPTDIFKVQGHPKFTGYMGEFNGDSAYEFQLEVSSEEAGLLKSIIQGVTGIKDKVGDMITKLTDGFSNVVNSITDLPSKIWEFIENGLKKLFIPTDSEMSEYSDKWDILLSNRFGAIYEVGSLMTDYVSGIQETAKQDTITIPNVSLEGVGIPFSFGGTDVKIVPDGFEVIVEVCKKILSIACTFLFVNGLRKRYDEVIRGINS